MIIYISHYHIDLCHGSNEGRLGESQYDTAGLKIKKVQHNICNNKIQIVSIDIVNFHQYRLSGTSFESS